ncbi:orotate phosphoribosyltransferase [Deltaproteobacteria bacterium]|nr:orotate phosphoribosyltransferase [Deltaproteobacteria bacterium]
MPEPSVARMKAQLAKILVERSYMEGDFILSSGKRSDYYFDCRQTSLHPEGAWLIGSLFNELLKDFAVSAVGGMTMGADPLVSSTSVISHIMGRPLAGLIVRKAPKDHGTGRYIEGLANVKAGDRVAMLEDVVSTGDSVLQAAKRVVDAGLSVAAICCVLDRGEGGREILQQSGYSLTAIFTRPELVALARE